MKVAGLGIVLLGGLVLCGCLWGEEEGVDAVDVPAGEGRTEVAEWDLAVELGDNSCSYHVYVDDCDGPEILALECGVTVTVTNNSDESMEVKSATGALAQVGADAACSLSQDLEPSAWVGDDFMPDPPFIVPAGAAVQLKSFLFSGIDEALDACNTGRSTENLELQVTLDIEVKGKPKVVNFKVIVDPDTWYDYDACVLRDEDWREE